MKNVFYLFRHFSQGIFFSMILLSHTSADQGSALRDVLIEIEEAFPEFTPLPISSGEPDGRESFKGSHFARSGFVWRDNPEVDSEFTRTGKVSNVAFDVTIHRYDSFDDAEIDVQASLDMRSAGPDSTEYRVGTLYMWRSGGGGHFIFQYGPYVIEFRPRNCQRSVKTRH